MPFLPLAGEFRKAQQAGHVPPRLERLLKDSLGLDPDAQMRRLEKRMEEQLAAEAMDGFPEISQEAAGRLPHPETLRANNHPLYGEVRRLWDALKKPTKRRTNDGRTVDRVNEANAFFLPIGEMTDLDRVREALNERGFEFDTITDMLGALDVSLSYGKPVYGTASMGQVSYAMSSNIPYERLKAIREMPAIHISTESIQPAAARELYEKLGRSKLSDGSEVVLVKGTYGKLAGHQNSSQILRLVPQFEELMGSAIPAYEEASRNPSKQHNITAFHNVVAKVELDGRNYFVRFTIQEVKKPDGNEFHNATLSDVEMSEATIADIHSGIIDPASISSSGLDKPLIRWMASVNTEITQGPASMAMSTGKDGWREVFHSGSFKDAYDPTKADMDAQYGPGFYSAESPKRAKGYGKVEPRKLWVRTVKTFDHDARINRDEANRIVATMDKDPSFLNWLYDDEKESGTPVTGEDVWNALKDDLTPLLANEALELAGYDSATYTGNRGKDRDWIVFQPDQVRTSNPSDIDSSQGPASFAMSGLARPLFSSTKVHDLRHDKTAWMDGGASPAGADEIVSKYYKTAAFAGIPRDAVLVPMPSTSGRNSLPDALARRVSKDFGQSMETRVVGIAIAKGEAKNKRTFFDKEADPVGFVPVSEVLADLAGKKVFITEDVHNTGESWIAFARMLQENGVDVAGVAALVSTEQRMTSPRDIERLSEKVAAQTGKSIDEVRPLLHSLFDGTFKQLFNKAEADVTRSAGKAVKLFDIASSGRRSGAYSNPLRGGEEKQRGVLGDQGLNLFGESWAMSTAGVLRLDEAIQKRMTRGPDERIDYWTKARDRLAATVLMLRERKGNVALDQTEAERERNRVRDALAEMREPGRKALPRRGEFRLCGGGAGRCVLLCWFLAYRQ